MTAHIICDPGLSWWVHAVAFERCHQTSCTWVKPQQLLSSQTESLHFAPSAGSILYIKQRFFETLHLFKDGIPKSSPQLSGSQVCSALFTGTAGGRNRALLVPVQAHSILDHAVTTSTSLASLEWEFGSSGLGFVLPSPENEQNFSLTAL